MSFPSPPAYEDDKGSGLFRQSYIDPSNDFFDQFLTFDSIDNDCPIISVLPETTVSVKSYTNQAAGTSATSGTSVRLQDRNTSQAIKHISQNDSWDFLNHPPSPRHSPQRRNQLHSAESNRDAISDSELLSLEGIHLQSPHIYPTSPSLPPTPSPSKSSNGGSLRRKKRFSRSVSTFQRPPKPESDTQRSPIRKPSSPAKMMRSSQYSEHNLEEWSQRLAVEASKFDFGFSQPPVPLSPPPSARVSDASDSSHHGMMSAVDQHNAFSWDHPVQQYATRNSASLHTPLTTPNSDLHTFNPQQLHHHQSSQDLGFQPPNQNHHAYIAPSEFKEQFNNFAGPNYTEGTDGPPVWWSQAQASPMSHPPPPGANYQRGSHQATKSLAMQLQNELAFNANELALSPSSLPTGLMIQLPPSPTQQSFVVPSSPLAPHGQGYFAASHYNPNGPQNPHMPSPQQQLRYTKSTPFLASQMRKSRSRDDGSDSPSPTSSSTPHFSTPNFSTPHGNFQIAKNRNRSMSRKHSEPMLTRAPKSGSGGGLVDFVNFTPHDSMKILTGVAPSGSSKTKARREKEAMEKRRRLSQAAVRAVQAAGGSIESLVEEGLFV